MAVLTAGAGLSAFGIRLAPEHEQRLGATWRQLHADVARLSSRGTQTVVEGSGHFVQRDRPDAVVEAIRWVVDQVHGGAGAADRLGPAGPV